MWTRKELKDIARPAFRANYWKAVLVALILTALMGGFGLTSSTQELSDLSSSTQSNQSYVGGPGSGIELEFGSNSIDGNGANISSAPGMDSFHHGSAQSFGTTSSFGVLGTIMAWLGVFVIALIVTAIAVLLYIFLLSPLAAGARRFFLCNLHYRAEVKELAFAYDQNYLETVKTLFLRDLFTCLWTLLFVVPGIIKSYEYRMIPYLLADDPTMTKDRAFVESKRLMKGQKWNAFVLDLSFIGWDILSVLTLGILYVFYVGPYQAQTNAALYERLRYGAGWPTQGAPIAPTAPNAPEAPVQAGPQTPNAPAQAAPGMANAPAQGTPNMLN